MVPKLIPALLLSTFLASAGYAADLDLACVGGTSTVLKSREVLVNEEHESHTVRSNSAQGARKMVVQSYAVMIEIVGEERGSREKWEVLSGDQFDLKPTQYYNNRAVAFEFVDLRSNETYDCGLNKIVRINPAVSRSN
jgi:hypothetical protein